MEASAREVWNAFTTTKGLQSWQPGVQVDIELSVGGKMRTNYTPGGVLGDEHTIENTIIAFDPPRMLSMRCTKAPEGFPFARSIANTWSVMYFDELSANRTRLRIVGLGYTEDEESQQMRAFFSKANPMVFAELSRKFAPGNDGASQKPPVEGDALQVARKLVGGEWIHEATRDDGSVMRVRNVAELGPDGQSVVTKGWLGDAKGMFYHGSTQIWREPSTGQVRYQNIDQDGTIARGAIRLTAKDALVWDWDSEAEDGKKTSYRVITAFQSDEAYRMKMQHRGVNGEYVELLDIGFRRVDRAPDAFLRMVGAEPTTD